MIEGYFDLKFKPQNGSYHARYDLGERFGTGHFGYNLTECAQNILETVARGTPGSFELRSVLEWDDSIEGLESLPLADIELLVMELNEREAKSKFSVGRVAKSP